MMNIVILTGAGISAEAGINTFRGQDGLWEGHRIEDVASPEGFSRDPQLVYDFYNQRRRVLHRPDLKPTAAHEALSRLERWSIKKGSERSFLLITQNVDNLHERSGSQRILHMHGELLKARSLDSGGVFNWEGDLDHSSRIDAEPEATLRPHIVWFGEMPLFMDEIEHHLNVCDLFLSIGTSGWVYPAAGFVRWCPKKCRKVEFNIEGTEVSNYFDEHQIGPSSSTVPTFIDQLISSQ